MEQPGKIYSINISPEKGVRKNPVSKAVISMKGIEGDGHSGDWHRQVSFLSYESIVAFNTLGKGKINAKPGDFGENITTKGIDYTLLKIGDTIAISPLAVHGQDYIVILEVTQIGKECLAPCRIYYEAGFCIMPLEGIFCKVIKSGVIKKGYSISVRPSS